MFFRLIVLLAIALLAPPDPASANGTQPPLLVYPLQTSHVYCTNAGQTISITASMQGGVTFDCVGRIARTTQRAPVRGAVGIGPRDYLPVVCVDRDQSLSASYYYGTGRAFVSCYSPARRAPTT